MPKPTLVPEDNHTEHEAIECMLEGLKDWRPDLNYPESHSDMEACFRGLFVMFQVKRRSKPRPLRFPCVECDGLGYLNIKPDSAGIKSSVACKTCGGKKYSEQKL